MKRYQEVAVDSLYEAISHFYKQGHTSLFAMLANDERDVSGAFAIYYMFYDQEGLHTIKTAVSADRPEYPSIVPLVPAAAWYEREIHDLFGLVPQGHPACTPLVLHENFPPNVYPLRKDFNEDMLNTVAGRDYPMDHVHGAGVFEVPVGPVHAGIIEPGHFRFSQAGEHTIHLDAKLFFTHRGIEKAVEGMPLEQAFYQAERICGACTVAHALSYTQAIEQMAGVIISPRAVYLRMLVAELERLYNHIGDIGNLCAGVGFAVGISQGARLKEKLMRLNESLTGNRFLRGMVTLGGTALDLPTNFQVAIQSELNSITAECRELVDILQDSEFFQDRVLTTGILPKQTAIALGAVGVAARASGVDIDLRRDLPYLAYGQMDFKVPLQHAGDVAARMRQRAEEVPQSLAIITQVLDGLPEYREPLQSPLPDIAPYTWGYGWSESARGSNLHWLMTGEHNTVYRLYVRSASFPNWPAVAAAVPGNIIPDFPLINKSFELCYACMDR